MRTIIATFIIEQDMLNNTYRTIGTTVITRHVEKLPVKYSWLKKEAEKELADHYRIKCLESICDITDLIDFDEN